MIFHERQQSRPVVISFARQSAAGALDQDKLMEGLDRDQIGDLIALIRESADKLAATTPAAAT